MTEMKALTIWQPWAQLIIEEQKGFETRPRRMNHRGKLAIHAAMMAPWEILRELPERVARAISGALGHEYEPEAERALERLPRGKVIGTAEVTACYKIIHVCKAVQLQTGYTEVTVQDGARFEQLMVRDEEILFGDWRPGRYAIRLENVKRMRPVPAKGKQGLWNWQIPA